jgi:hypothetical protein
MSENNEITTIAKITLPVVGKFAASVKLVQSITKPDR